MADRLDVESFISEVKKFPEIWDVNCEDHRYKKRKQRAWSEVARVFIPDFDAMAASDKAEICKYRSLHSEHSYILVSICPCATKNLHPRYYCHY